jgi:hypothetical protein
MIVLAKMFGLGESSSQPSLDSWNAKKHVFEEGRITVPPVLTLRPPLFVVPFFLAQINSAGKRLISS